MVQVSPSTAGVLIHGQGTEITYCLGGMAKKNLVLFKILFEIFDIIIVKELSLAYFLIVKLKCLVMLKIQKSVLVKP